MSNELRDVGMRFVQSMTVGDEFTGTRRQAGGGPTRCFPLQFVGVSNGNRTFEKKGLPRPLHAAFDSISEIHYRFIISDMFWSANALKENKKKATLLTYRASNDEP